ncbi:alpha-glucan family phosphorylase [Marinobacter sp. M216]|uniref:Alpha-glucan family phosphorylase n=1 Tax=Marinobacter albus TaxID=3030833 RepID=A0ABT7HE86_9GAMM|nr:MULTISPECIES: alpha-glucan family phosphorylase [unclassified Marinobacter]MBW7469869.1 alpha-glucan family phosphorylase [Marinobacter sp. F4218]MDK9557871.1 alpha-glucan family phosphorylase [Marinobacter sp. M216]
MNKATEFRLEARPRVPEVLERLEELANNLFYSWDHGVRNLFARIDLPLWQKVEHNPKLFLRRVAQERLDEAAEDRAFLSEYRRILGSYDAYLESESGPEVDEILSRDTELVAYFCAEFGFHESFPIYSGGLGILAGDHCKAASDLGLPFVAVGLLYQQGYFIQTIDPQGQQVARYQSHFSDELPISAVELNGEPLKVAVPFPDRNVVAQVWKAQVGHIDLYLLDTHTHENNAEDRELTLRLYGGDESTRISQEMLLGIGGTRVLDALGLAPTVWHINEGHAAFQILERCRQLMAGGLDFEAALEAVAAATLFTTHTPVAAGHDIFSRDLLLYALGAYLDESGLDFEKVFALGSKNGDESFNMTSLGLRGSRFHNGVSRIHGSVASDMEGDVWPQIPAEENPIGYITNGVHVPTFLAPEWASLFDIQAPTWRSELRDRDFWEFVERIPDYHYWSVHKALKQQMGEFVVNQLQRQHVRNGTGHSVTDRMTRQLISFDKDTLVIGFARRFATYKRATLIFSDLARLERILTDRDHPVVLVFAGKAHPKDKPGQHLIKVIHDLSMQASLMGHVILLEDYDQAMARHLLSGVDVWLNTPEYPKEASGTSGEKAALNGALNLSVLDGWWGEGYDGENGWAITPRNLDLDAEFRNEEEARDLLDLLEFEIVPLYYNRASQGYSKGWVKRSKASMKTITPRFNSQRMVMDYVERYYSHASMQGKKMLEDDAAIARELGVWKQRVREAWPGVSLNVQGCVESRCAFDETIELRVEANLNGLAAGDVRVECLVTPQCVGSYQRSGDNRVLLKEESDQDGKTVFSAQIAPPYPGLQTLRLRMYPYHDALTHPLEMGALLWI